MLLSSLTLMQYSTPSKIQVFCKRWSSTLPSVICLCLASCWNYLTDLSLAASCNCRTLLHPQFADHRDENKLTTTTHRERHKPPKCSQPNYFLLLEALPDTWPQRIESSYLSDKTSLTKGLKKSLIHNNICSSLHRVQKIEQKGWQRNALHNLHHFCQHQQTSFGTASYCLYTHVAGLGTHPPCDCHMV